MAKTKKGLAGFPHVKGLAKKRTKFGHRWILTDKDGDGVYHSVTVKILDTDSVGTFYKKVEEARKKIKNVSTKTFETYLDEYFGIRQLAKNTIRLYRKVLSDMSFDDNENRKRVLELLRSDRKKSTIHLYISVINTVFSWLIQRGVDVRNPTVDVAVKCNRHPRSRIMTDEEIEKLLLYIDKKGNLNEMLFVRLLLHTGARVSTLLALKADDYRGGYLYLYNVKCKKRYDFPMPLRDKKTISLWEAVTRTEKEYIFSSRDCLSLRSTMRHLFPKDQDGESLSPHSIRHTFASRAAQRGVPLEIVAKLLDHASVATTMKVYAKFSQAQIDSAIDTTYGIDGK